jgi:hypothetical protein
LRNAETIVASRSSQSSWAGTAYRPEDDAGTP